MAQGNNLPKALAIAEGSVFGHLTVLSQAPTRKSAHWYVKCLCGKVFAVRGVKLRSGKAKGCRNCAMLSHGMSRTATYKSWKGMRYRCTNPNCAAWENYGGRGITVCSEWEDFAVFLADMGVCPEGLTIERLDNNSGYSKSNCVWATRHEQGRNKRTNRFVEFQGEAMTLAEASIRSKIKYSTLLERLKVGATDIFRPVKGKEDKDEISTQP